MRIKLPDDNANYLKWGLLVKDWIYKTQAWPQTVQDLRDQMSGRGILGCVEGDPGRQVAVTQYGDSDQPLELVIPSTKMFEARFNLAQAGPYPRELMPSFMDIAYGGAARVDLSLQEAQDFAIRRVGEYTVNECC